MKKTIAGVGLALMGIAILFALVSFWRENWGANQTPGAVERFLAGWLLSGSRGQSVETPNPVPSSPENLTEGHDLYLKQCAFCHGEDGTGGGGSGVQFYPPVPSLLMPQNELTDSQMHYVIEQGVRYTGMPSFDKALNEEQIWKVVLWIRTLPNSAHEGSQP